MCFCSKVAENLKVRNNSRVGKFLYCIMLLVIQWPGCSFSQQSGKHQASETNSVSLSLSHNLPVTFSVRLAVGKLHVSADFCWPEILFWLPMHGFLSRDKKKILHTAFKLCDDVLQIQFSLLICSPFYNVLSREHSSFWPFFSVLPLRHRLLNGREFTWEQKRIKPKPARQVWM